MPTLLIADDNTTMQLLYKTVFEKNGIQIETALDGQATLNLLHTHRLPDAVLLDIMLPLLDGFEILQLMKADPELSAIPVIAFTNLAGDEIKTQAINKGAIACLKKDEFTPVTLYQQVIQLLKFD
jgi:CheY-like chemotaxis protein